jgi:hypothetical protein
MQIFYRALNLKIISAEKLNGNDLNYYLTISTAKSSFTHTYSLIQNQMESTNMLLSRFF